MEISRHQLEKAVSADIITSSQAEALLVFLDNTNPHIPQFSLTHVLYYFGGLIAIGAMTLFMTLGWESFGGVGIMAITVIYGIVGLALTNHFAARQLQIPAGICATFVVCLTPLFIYGLQDSLGVWPADDSVYQDYHRRVQWNWLYMELATLAAGAIIVWKYRYPFLMMPVAVTLWYLSMDITAMLTGGDLEWELRKLVSVYTGLLMIALAFWVDMRSVNKADYAFWIYLFGVTAFWMGLSLQESDSELNKFLYLCTNLLLIGVGIILNRRVFAVFGALGTCGYLGHLAFDVFRDSWLFPISLTIIGLAIVYLGIIWQRHEADLTRSARRFLPLPLQKLLESRE
ncbi:MAG: DUF2157 domain-containing protein [Pseudomonadales bacterium]|nr:DUF2157 domain-containing protein [Pseudomonadales bacterium]